MILCRLSVAPTGSSSSSFSMSLVPFCFMVSGFDDLVVDAQVLRHRGLSDTVILTLLSD